MKFFYKGQLVRTSKTHVYTHAALREMPDGSISLWGCSTGIAGALRYQREAAKVNIPLIVVELEHD